MRSLVLVRTHKANELALSAFDRYRDGSGLPVVFVCDERARPLDLGGRAKVAWNEAALDRLGLLKHPQAGWRCGDYCYYLGREAHPDHDYYWLIEPDVYINVADLKAFFTSFDDVTCDFIGVNFTLHNRFWQWTRTIDPEGGDVFGCVYSISRLSARAVDALKAERVSLSANWGIERYNLWPNDEAFTANTLMRLQLDCADFNSFGRVLYNKKTFRNGAPFDKQRLQMSAEDGRIHHPVKSVDGWTAWAAKKFDIIDINKLNHASHLLSLGRAMAETDEARDVSLIPYLRALDVWEKGEFPNETISPEIRLRKANKAGSPLRKIFQPKNGSPQVGNAHIARSRVRPSATILCKPDDFDRTNSIPVIRIPRRNFLPYAWDLEGRRLFGTLHMCPSEVMSAPFIYAAQREHAKVVADVDLRSLDGVFGEYSADVAPIFVFSIGRVGSTLFNSMLRAAIPRSVSEPGTLSQLPSTRKVWSELQSDAVRRVLWHSISAFYATDLGVEDDGKVVLKLRSQVNAVADVLAAHFPNAMFVFVLRDREPWARSTYRAFRVAPEEAARRLRQGISTIAVLKERAARFEVLSYEGILANPDGAIEAIVGAPLSAEVRETVKAVMAQDSQKGTGVSRERTRSRNLDEDAWLASFDKVWQDVRPRSLINRLQLDY